MDLSEDVADEWFVNFRRSIDKFEEVKAIAMLLHHHHKLLALVERLKHLLNKEKC